MRNFQQIDKDRAMQSANQFIEQELPVAMNHPNDKPFKIIRTTYLGNDGVHGRLSIEIKYEPL